MGFKIDRPIENSGEDLLNRSKFAKYVADAIASLNDEHHGTVIGIQGHWGCGKTSLAKMVKQELQSINGQSKNSIKKMKFLHLETWLATDRETLIREFFTLILNAVDSEIDKDGKLHVDIKKYANEFGRRLIRSASFGFQPCGIGISFDGAELIGSVNEPSLDEQKQKINIKLGKNEMPRFIFFIDDIDRLSYEDIAVLFQLIKNIGDFNNITYVLCYDKEIVGKALDKVHSDKGYQYIEKVIQIPIDVPTVGKGYIDNYFLNLLNPLAKEIPYVCFDEEHFRAVYHNGISACLQDLRDCNRLYNAFSFKHSIMNADCDFADLLAFTLLEIKYPWLIKIIKDNQEMFLGYNQFIETNISKDQAKQFWSVLTKYLKAEDKKKLESIIAMIFPRFGKLVDLERGWYSDGLEKSTNKICIEEAFLRYFEMSILNDDVSDLDVEVWLHSTEEGAFKKQLLIWQQCGKLNNALYVARKHIKIYHKDNIDCVFTKEVLIEFLHALSKCEFSEDSKGMLQVSDKLRVKFIIDDLIDRFIDINEDKISIIKMLGNDSNISLTIALDIVHGLAQGFEWRYGREPIEIGKTVITKQEFEFVLKLFSQKIKVYAASNDILLVKDAVILLKIWKYVDIEEYNEFLLKHKSQLDILKFVCASVTMGIVHSTGEPDFWQWYLHDANWIEDIDFDKAVVTVNESLETGLHKNLDNEMQMKVFAFVALAKQKQENKGPDDRAYRYEVREEDFKLIIEKYGSEVDSNNEDSPDSET